MSSWQQKVLKAARDQKLILELVSTVLALENGSTALSNSFIKNITRRRDSMLLAIDAGDGIREASVRNEKILNHCTSECCLSAFVASLIFPSVKLDNDEFHSERQPLRDPTDLLSAYEEPVHSTLSESITAEIHSGYDVGIFGRSASGKTVAALQAANAFSTIGWTVIWFDLSEPERDVWDLVGHLIAVSKCHPIIVFIDDAQAQLSEIKRIADVLALVRSQGVRVRIVAMAWESARPTVLSAFGDMHIVPAQGDLTLARMIHSQLGAAASEVVRQQIVHVAAGDLVVGNLIVEHLKQHREFPKASELGKMALNRLIRGQGLTDAAAEMVYRAASLSQFEIDAAAQFIKSVSPSDHDSLLRHKVLRANGGYVAIGHRTIARLILPELREKLSNKKLPSPNKLAVDYLQTADSRQLLNILERLDLARRGRSEKDQHGARYLVQLWETLGILLATLNKQGELDPTWKDNTGSGILACKALWQFRYESADTTAEYVRLRWQLPNDEDLPRLASGPTDERKDFDEIARCMAEEESLVSLPHYAERASSIDRDSMHRTWVLGLLLGFEARCRDGSPERLQRLKQIAKRHQLANGSFYPARVPWVTARVLIGLSEAGETVDSSEVVKRACNWLLTDSPDGPFQMGAWPSHTGSWNTTAAITAMCLNAVIRCGVPAEHPSVKFANTYLEESKSEWSQLGNEIDAAFAIETFLLTSPHWRGLTKELSALIYWARNPATWIEVVKDATLHKDESVKVPFIASSLVGVIWSIVRLELPLLLEDASTGHYLSQATGFEPVKPDTERLFKQIDEIGLVVRSNIEHRLSMIQRTPELGPSIRETLQALREQDTKCEQLRRRVQALERASSAAQYEEEKALLLRDVEELGTMVISAEWGRSYVA